MSYRRIRFDGYSMYPALRPGDTLILDVAPTSDCSIGDIVCIPGRNALTAHRIIVLDRRVSPPVFVTKGDNLAYVDPPVAVPADGVLRVVMVSRGGRRLIRPRFRRLTAALSRRNATVGIIKAALGRAVRRVFGRFLELFHQGAQRS
jgi:signal peptidase I